MKIRNGFVSNSSSSSFLIGFNKKPKTIGELQKILFGDTVSLVSPYDETTSYTTDCLAQIIFNDIKNQSPLKQETLIETVLHHSFNGEPEYPSHVASEKELNEYRKTHREVGTKYAENIKNTIFKNKEIYIVRYSDDTDIGTMLEHGDIFDNIPNVRFSEH